MHALTLVTHSYALLETMAIQKLQMEIVIFVTTHSVDSLQDLGIILWPMGLQKYTYSSVHLTANLPHVVYHCVATGCHLQPCSFP